MCGDASADHPISVDEMIATIIDPPSTSTPTELKGEDVEKQVHRDSAAAKSTENMKSKKNRSVKITVAPIEVGTSSYTTSQLEENDIDEEANMFQIKQDGRKQSKNMKGGRGSKVRMRDKETARMYTDFFRKSGSSWNFDA